MSVEMTVRLQPEHERKLEELLASGKFASMEEAVAQALGQFLLSQEKPIWEELQDIRDSISADAFDDLPADASVKHDHYIYGTPKQSS